MNVLRTITFMLAALLLAACSRALLPPAERPVPARQDQGDADLMGRLRMNWQLLQQKGTHEAERAVALRDYNADLLLLLRRLRHDTASNKQSQISRYFRTRHHLGASSLRLGSVYDDMVPSTEVPLEALKERYTEYGLGVPMVGVIPAEKVTHSQQQLFNIGTRGTVTSITAVLEFAEDGQAELVLIPRQRENTYKAGKVEYLLAADWSATLEVYWNLTRVNDDRLLGLLRPQELRSTTGLSTIEPYDPDKIPVILTHGLASSANTFDNLVNRLMADPVVRDNFQFWYFNYPTGVAWTISAKAYREALAHVRSQVDPRHSNRNWDNMVVVGHSMGGLITHYSQCEQPWNLLRGGQLPESALRQYLNPEYVDKPFPDPELEPLRKDYFFKPVQAGLVVYMATPHRGAPVAQYRLVTMLAKLVTLPQNLIKEAYNIATLQSDMLLLNPQDAYLWFTSVNQLKPDSYSIRGLQGLKVRDVPTHSVIGDRGDDDCPKCTDGVVPYWSSHIAWGTETIVPYDHSVQDCKETAVDMKKVLDAYAQKHPAVTTSGVRKPRIRILCTGPVSHRGNAVKK